MGLRNHFADYPEFVMAFELHAKSIMDEVEETCQKMNVEHKVYCGERINDFEYHIKVQGVPLYVRTVIIGYDGYLEFGYLSLCDERWVHNYVCKEQLSENAGKIYLGKRELTPGRHSLIPYINKIIDTTVKGRNILAYCPTHKTWHYTECQQEV